MSRLGAPRFAVGIFVAIGVVFVLLILDFHVGRSVLHADSQRLTARRTWLGLGRTRTFPASDIDTITSIVGFTSGSQTHHDLAVKLRSGGTARIAKNIATRHDAEMLAAKLRQRLGR